MSMSHGFKKTFLPILLTHGALTLFASLMLLGRILVTSKATLAFLFWNIFLAWIPLGLALWLVWYKRAAKQLDVLAKVVLLGWLFFFPNAPYVVTDFVHLTYVAWYGDVPVWFDIILLMAFAMNGLLLGLSSLYLIQQFIGRYYSRLVTLGSVMVFLFFGSLGIYLGRFLRWNSWDVITQPQELVFDIFDIFVNPWQHSRSIWFTLFYFIFLLTTYGCLCALAKLSSVLPQQKTLQS